MRKLLNRITNSIINNLTAPPVRYKVLPRLHEVMSYNRKEQILYTCLEYAHRAEVKGDYLEFGMWKGGSMIAAYHLSQQFPGLSNMTFYGFDSFEGIPSLKVNRSEAQEFPPGMFGTAMEEVRRNLRNAKVKTDRVTLIPGWYAETLNQKTKERLPLKTAAIVNIDCDVYESTVPVLDFIEAYLADGSVLIFDDWYCFRNKRELGEQKAFREWLERNRHLRATPYKEFGWDGKAFIINRIAGNGPSLPEHEYLFDLVNDSVMMRTMEGRIKLWNRRAEELYGWKKEEAIGTVSHNLLQTKFPKPLQEIESELVQNGRWEGRLVQATRDGGHVMVESRWVLDPKRQPAAVVEIHTRSSDS